jgi:amidohydrolase
MDRFLSRNTMSRFLLLLAALSAAAASATTGTTAASLHDSVQALQPKMVAWRRDFHQFPELGNQEVRTAKIIAAHLRKLGLEVQTNIAVTCVTGILRGAAPGKKIAIRADIDALPVVEDNALPFASKVRGSYRGQSVGVMHACGHDAHTAILLGVAELLTQRRKELSGEVMFVFQPAEEGPPEVGQPFGAALMLQEGVFAKFKPDAIFGLHVWAALPVGQIGFRAGPTMAAADEWTLRITGKQTHGSRPWDGVDPITVAAHIQLALQSIVARQIDIVKSPIVLTTGAISGGVRYNIIPDTVNMTGTLRSFDPAVRADVIARFNRTAKALAEASGATAELVVSLTAPLTSNDVILSAQAAASLQRSMGVASVVPMPLLTIAEDFSQFSAIAPTFYYFVGATAPDVDPKRAPMNHSPQFMLDEKALQIGAESMTQLALDTLK